MYIIYLSSTYIIIIIHIYIALFSEITQIFKYIWVCHDTLITTSTPVTFIQDFENNNSKHLYSAFI